MKNTLLKSVLIAALASSPLMLSAQTKGGTASGTSTGEASRPAEARERDAKKAGLKDNDENEGRMRNNTAMFDRLDADKDGSISREEFAKMGANRARPNKDRNNANRTGTERTRPQAGGKNNATDNTKDSAADTDTKVKDEDIKETTTPSAEAATRTTGTTGGTGSSASGAGQSGAANSGTGVDPQ